MIHDERGSTFLETLIALPVLFVGFVTLLMFSRLAVAHLIVQRAAAAGARAAVVILPDDPDYYDSDGAASKQQCIEEAVRRVLKASPHFALGSGSLDLKLTGSKRDFDPLSLVVTARYDCKSFLGSARFFSRMLCGQDRVATLKASSTLPYQMGPLEK